MPLIYWKGALIADWARVSMSKWFGSPLWVYTIPIASFLTFDLGSPLAADEIILCLQVSNFSLPYPQGRLFVCFGRVT